MSLSLSAILTLAPPFVLGGETPDDGTGPGWFALSRPIAGDVDDEFDHLAFAEDES